MGASHASAELIRSRYQGGAAGPRERPASASGGPASAPRP
jgi:hypothetical protein